ncbi:MAG: M14 family zinc carboxypeptidase [bacterium]
MGIDVHEGIHKKGYSFTTDLSESEIARLRENDVKVEVLINDIAAFYRERALTQKDLMINRDLYDTWQIPENWEYGSMAGFYTMDEAMAELDSMYALYPELITERLPISEDTLTWEGRKIYWLKISDNPDMDEDEPEVLFTSLHHARELMSIQQQIFFMWYLLENYETDPAIKYLVDNTEMYFIPVINPDGYQYNCTNDPEGGGMWRKNLRDNGDGSFGVDLNRNYGYQWGLDDQGSSPWTEDATYRGPAPFSEPENKNIRDFCNAHEFRIALNYHSYGNLLLSPWGYTPDLPEDSTLFNVHSALMTNENLYVYGPGNTSIYPTNGGSDDWMYGDIDFKEEILSYTPEIGTNGDGFWPEPQRIIPLCREQMWQNLTAARLAGKYAVATDLSPMVLEEESGYLAFDIQRMGLMDNELFTVSLAPLDDYLVEVGEAAEFEDMTLLETRVDSIGYLLDAAIEEGTEIQFLLQVSHDDITYQDTITKVFGEEVTLFADDCESMDNWNSGDWNITEEQFMSPTHSITDSPDGNYEDGRTTLINLDTVVDLQNANRAFVKFHASWDIEEGYDYVQLLISPAEVTDWQPLEGIFTSTGSIYQDPGQPVYDGMSEWVKEQIDISEYVGQQVKLRFWMRSDNYVHGDGFYFDDLEVTAILDDITSIRTSNQIPDKLFLSEAYPNPADRSFKVQYKLQHEQETRFELYDSYGKLILSRTVDQLEGVLTISTDEVTPGIYLYRIVDGAESSTVQKVILR